jgi:preprotein translocase subunit SecE
MPWPSREDYSMDVIFVVVAVVFFSIAWAYIVACERI